MIDVLVQAFLSVRNLLGTTQVAPTKDVTEITNESVYGKHLTILFKMDLRVQMDAKSGQLKIESMRSGVASKGELQYLYT